MLACMKIVVATSNPHKIDEIKAVWYRLISQRDAHNFQLIGLSDIDPGSTIPEPLEDQDTFEANALLKARYYAAATGQVCLADDSGLEVDALGGQPGVRSARYAGVTGPRPVVDQANNKRLLEQLQDVPAQQRAARFVCAMALETPKPLQNDSPSPPYRPQILHQSDITAHTPIIVRGAVEGKIIGPGERARGHNGFGYDPLFFVPHLGKTTAELSPQEKNAISHRGQAARLMWNKIEQLAVK